MLKSRKKPLITPGGARRRAERHVLAGMFKGARVMDGAESGHQVYGVRREDTWVVYKNSPVMLVSGLRIKCLRELQTGNSFPECWIVWKFGQTKYPCRCGFVLLFCLLILVGQQDISLRELRLATIQRAARELAAFFAGSYNETRITE
jgi:hypothetical protein